MEDTDLDCFRRAKIFLFHYLFVLFKLWQKRETAVNYMDISLFQETCLVGLEDTWSISRLRVSGSRERGAAPGQRLSGAPSTQCPCQQGTAPQPQVGPWRGQPQQQPQAWWESQGNEPSVPWQAAAMYVLQYYLFLSLMNTKMHCTFCSFWMASPAQISRFATQLPAVPRDLRSWFWPLLSRRGPWNPGWCVVSLWRGGEAAGRVEAAFGLLT